MKSALFSSLIFAGASLLAAPAFAQATSNMAVTLSVDDECTIAAGPLAFGSTGLLDAVIDVTADLTVHCTIGSPYSIALSAGAGTAVTARVLTSITPAGTINYGLFKEVGRTTNWGETIGTDTLDSAAATGADETVVVYGRIPAGQTAPAGDYTDTIVATIWYGAAL